MRKKTYNPRISIIIPVYNVKKYLLSCLESVLGQTYENKEIIIVDDGSNDGSETICDEYAKRDSNVYVYHKSNGGLSSARNYGIERATGEWILFIDSDDWCDKEYINKIIKAYDPDKDVDVIISSSNIQRSNGEFYCRKPTFLHEGIYSSNAQVDMLKALTFCGQRFIKQKWDIELDSSAMNASPWDKLYKTSIIKDHKLRFRVETKVYEDSLFNIEYFDFVKKVLIVDAKGYYYRYVEASITKKADIDRLRKKHFYTDFLYDFCNSRSNNIYITKGKDLFFISESIELIKYISTCKHTLSISELKKRCFEFLDYRFMNEERNRIRIRDVDSIKHKICVFSTKYRLFCMMYALSYVV